MKREKEIFDRVEPISGWSLRSFVIAGNDKFGVLSPAKNRKIVKWFEDQISQERQSLLVMVDQLCMELDKLKLKTCDCEQTELGYHTKDCTFYEYGYNQALEDIKEILEESK